MVCAFPPLSERINPALPEEMVMATSEAVANHDTADSPKDPLPPPFFASRPLTRLKSQHAPKGKVQSVTHEKVHYPPKELLAFSYLYQQKSREYAWEWVLRMRGNSGRNKKWDQVDFIDLGPLSRDSAFNVASQELRKGSNCLVCWLAKIWIKRWPTVKKLEMPDCP